MISLNESLCFIDEDFAPAPIGGASLPRQGYFNPPQEALMNVLDSRALMKKYYVKKVEDAS